MYPFLVHLLHPFLLLMLAQGTTLRVLTRRAKSRRPAAVCFASYALLWLFCTPLVAHWSAALIERMGIHGMLDWQAVWRVAVQIGRALQAAPKWASFTAT